MDVSAFRALLFMYEHMKECRPRKDGTPAFLHPIRVALALAHNGRGHLIVPALLHDVVEDTDITVSDIRENFSPDVFWIVGMLTYPDGKRSEEGEAKLMRNMERHGTDLISLKLADNTDNISTILCFHPEKRLAYLEYAKRIQRIGKKVLGEHDPLVKEHAFMLRRAKRLVRRQEREKSAILPSLPQ
jgi:guanosine-3',5'-bis(diphosphate) 3'-pyrophosphohydrolase